MLKAILVVFILTYIYHLLNVICYKQYYAAFLQRLYIYW
ncbi:hypothetical protein UABAM_06651 [Candidatus Uabimicrobium amorphum]|uniref:Uncharacterized protein n=1 Tax=Uabimicrobium amorphum TaxID=2596890 RepID=A0A5S9IW89_UABAM|nr:hypothetical protein UABAM_06651 [Candidatus Uabimicrobium amorphum]